MARNTSIALGQHFSDFAEEQVRLGRYGSTSEVIRAGLRLLEDREAKLRSLRLAVEEGVASGPAASFDVESFLREKRHECKDA